MTLQRLHIQRVAATALRFSCGRGGRRAAARGVWVGVAIEPTFNSRHFDICYVWLSIKIKLSMHSHWKLNSAQNALHSQQHWLHTLQQRHCYCCCYCALGGASSRISFRGYFLYLLIFFLTIQLNLFPLFWLLIFWNILLHMQFMF